MAIGCVGALPAAAVLLHAPPKSLFAVTAAALALPELLLLLRIAAACACAAASDVLVGCTSSKKVDLPVG